MEITHYRFGSITVDGERYGSDVIVSPEGVDASWRRRKGHELCREDLGPVLALRPEALVIGTGAYGAVKVLPEAEELMQEKCARVHVLPTTQAWKKFNELVASGARVVAALHLTC